MIGDALAHLRALPADSVHCCVTSPPYWGLRDYGVGGQLGLEPTPKDFVVKMVEVFDEVFRVLRPDGTCWVNLGDSYFSGGGHADSAVNDRRGGYNMANRPEHEHRAFRARNGRPKDLVGIPWRVAFALQDSGWYLRQDIVWHKPNPMPESVRDRCTKAHEYIFLLTKSPRYFFDAASISEPVSGTAHSRGSGVNPKAKVFGQNSRINRDRDPDHQSPAKIRAKQNRSFSAAVTGLVERRNKRSVWTVAPRAYRGAHFATFPPQLIEPCILAGCPRGGVVLDPFGGSGTTGAVALQHGRNAILIELNPDYAPLIEARLRKS
ncbi:DNA-methyltransferase [Horticoccus sp. 23ND18S-11]|uniref:DNA-methyltransferase n=1 Tax=Horticoccus sp. 23ND18S-11 TaxID=3391832 RepID=UPI0039C8D5B5